MDLGFTGPTYTVATACSSANHAIGQAFRLVRDGEAEMAVTGGSEAPFVIGMLKAWEANARDCARHLPAVQQGSQGHDPG